MTDIPNCGNCSHCNISSITGKTEDCAKLSHWLLATEYNFVKEMGCLVNPDARAYLMAPVIEKLLMAIQTCDESAKEEAYEYAISLIKNGVK